MSWLVTLAVIAAGEAPPAEELLKKYDAIMGPESFEAATTMTAHREDGSSRTYKMKVLKAGNDRFRVWFQEPASVRGQEMLRQGENLWLYMPNLKKAVRMASRESFQGGDFNNADVLRAHYADDYKGRVLPDAGDPGVWIIELHAAKPDAAYEGIKLWIRRADAMPLKGEYYSASGKMLRAATFTDVKSFGGFKRPSRVEMRNMLAPKRFSVMSFESLNVKVKPPASKFILDDLGR